MQTITRNFEGKKLSLRIFVSDEDAFNVVSVIVMGEHDCILVDCQWTRANAFRVIAEILECGRELKAVYCTHAHPDHYWGMGEIYRVFPNAKYYAPAPVVTLYAHQYQPKLDEWEDIIGTNNLCRLQCPALEPLEQDYLELEGERLEIIRCMGDLMWNTVVWIPSIRTVLCSDVVVNEVHLFTCEVNAEQRKIWQKDVQGIMDLKPDCVVPGHMREGCPMDYSCLHFTAEYLKATEEEIARTNSPAEFFYHMFLRFPKANLLRLGNEMNAEVFKGGREWAWNEDPDPEWLKFRTAWEDEGV